MEVSANLKKAIEDYINGDTTAFTTIYNESHKYIYVCVNNVMSGNDNKEDLIQDIMQDTYVEISKHINSLQNVNLFLSWSGTIATRKCFEYIKKMGKYTLLNEDESFDGLADDDNIIPEEIVQNKEKQRLLREIIQNELSDMQKLCVVGYFYNEMKQSEIAKELNIPENSVKSHLLRAKAKIKESVLDLEKKKGTKLYAVTPILLLLFADEVEACTVSPAIGEAVLSSVGTSGAVTATAGTSGAVAGSQTVASTVSTVGATAAKTAVAAVKIKAIVIAAAAVVTLGGVGAGVGIAMHNKKQNVDNEPTKVVETTVEDTSEEVTTEEVTMADSIWDGVEFAECGQKYSMLMREKFFEINGEADFYGGSIIGGIENITVSKDKLIINLYDAELLFSDYDLPYLSQSFYCQLIDKNTGEIYKDVIIDYDVNKVEFDRDFDLEEYYLYISYQTIFMKGNIWTEDGSYLGLLYKIPAEESSETSIWDGVEFAKIGEMYETMLFAQSDSEDPEIETKESKISSMVETIDVTSDKVVVELADIKNIESNSHIDFNKYGGVVYCQLIDKGTGESIKTIVQGIDNTTVSFDKNNDVELSEVKFADCVLGVTYFHDWTWYESNTWLLFELPNAEPDDGLKSTLVEAAKKALEDYGYTDALAFSDYNGDGVPEFLALTGSAFGNLYGTMYKYENNEYVYYMDVNSFGDRCSRLYRDTTDGSYVVLEMDYRYSPVYDENYEPTDEAYSYNEVYFVDADTQESYIFKTIEGDDILSISDRTFYADDGTTMTSDEFFALLDSEMLPQYEYVGDLNYGYEYINDDNTELIAAYNYYLNNKLE